MTIFNSVNCKQIGRVAFAVVQGILALTLGGKIHAQLVRPDFSVVPYTVRLTENVYDKAGVLKSTNHYVEAVRSDGARVKRATAERLQQRNLYLPSGTFIVVNEVKGKKSTFLNKPDAAPLKRDPLASCQNLLDQRGGLVSRGKEVVDGHPSAKFVRGGLTLWYALDAGCAEIKTRLEHGTGVTEKKLETLILGEPDPALFQVSDWKEAPPSEVFANSPAAVDRYNKAYNVGRSQ